MSGTEPSTTERALAKAEEADVLRWRAFQRLKVNFLKGRKLHP